MALEDTLKQHLKEAMKAKDPVRLGTIRLVMADLKNETIAKGRPLNEGEELALLAKHAKQRREAIEAFHKGGREELAAAEKAELAVLETYLPKQLGDAEVEAMVAEVVAAVGAEGMRDIGKVMGKLMPRLRGKYDGKKAKTFVEAALRG